MQDLKFVKILTDVYLANAAAGLIESGNKDSSRQVLVSKALFAHGLDTIEFANLLSTYEKHPVKLKMVMDSVQVQMEKMQNSLRTNTPQ